MPMQEAVKELTTSLNERTNEHDQKPLKVRLLPSLSNVVVVDATGPHDVEISSARGASLRTLCMIFILSATAYWPSLLHLKLFHDGLNRSSKCRQRWSAAGDRG